MGNICYGCFKEIPVDSKCCPCCGYDDGANGSNYPQALPAGTVLNAQYVLGRVLGQGGFGITYIAQDYDSKEIVAVKEYFPSANATRVGSMEVMPFTGEKGENYAYGMECFVNEAFILAKFTGNLNIANVSCCFKENGTAYYVMEYVDGESFEDLIRERFEKSGGMSWDETAEIIDAVLNALTAVHSEGIIHRDIAPDNISIMRDGTVKLLDFGAARYSLGDATHSLDVVLKHGFAPKEQYSRRGKQGPFTDIYAVAATMYYAITGHKPPDAIDRADRDELALPSAMQLAYPVSRDQEAVLLKALAVDACDRYQSAEAFRRDLQFVTNTPESLYQRALSIMADAENASALQQAELYQSAMVVFGNILAMPNTSRYVHLCKENMKSCQQAALLSIEQTLQLAQEKAETDPLQPQAEAAYAEALTLTEKTAQMVLTEEVRAQCDHIRKTCKANMELYALTFQIEKARRFLETELPAKEKRKACLEAQKLLKEVESQTNSQHLQNECNRALVLCQSELRRLDSQARKFWAALAASLTAVVAAVVTLLTVNFNRTPALPLATEPMPQAPVLTAIVTKGNRHCLYIALENADDYQNLKFYVWNAEDTSNKKTSYVPQKKNGCWMKSIQLTDLESAGTYRIEAYGTLGEESCLAARTEVLVEQITLTDLRLSVSQENAAISIAMDKVPGYTDVSFAVWGNENQGNDLTWYQAEEKNGEWVYQADLLEHNELGLYFVHAYANKNGEKVMIAQGQANVEAIPQPELSAWLDYNMQDLQVLLEKAGGNTHISVAVWRERDGEAGAQWFSTNPGSNGIWTCSVDLRKFSGPGNFVVQVYGRKNDVYDPEKMIASAVVPVNQILPYAIYSAASAKNQSMWVGMTCPVKDVRFGVWGQDYGSEDLVFYDGVKTKDGNWECTIDLSKHLGSNAYFVHAYGKVGGKDTLIAATWVVLE